MAHTVLHNHHLVALNIIQATMDVKVVESKGERTDPAKSGEQAEKQGMSINTLIHPFKDHSCRITYFTGDHGP